MTKILAIFTALMILPLLLASPAGAVANQRAAGQVDETFPGGAADLKRFVEDTTPHLERFLGAPMSIDPVSFHYDSDPNAHFGQSPKNNEVIIGGNTIQPGEETNAERLYSLHEAAAHEFAHLFYDIGDYSLPFYEEQWLWEAHAETGVRLALWEMEQEVPTTEDDFFNTTGKFNDGGARDYDFIANVPPAITSGVHQMSRKANMSLMYNAAVAPYMYLVMTTYPKLDGLANLNQALYNYWRENFTGINFAQYLKILAEVLPGKTVDGVPAAEWLAAQPITQTSGAAGIFLGVIPRYGNDYGQPGRVELNFFQRTVPQDQLEIQEKEINDATATITLIDFQKNTVASFQQSTATKDFGLGTNPENQVLNPGVYKISATVDYQGQTYEADNAVIFSTVRQPRAKVYLYLGFIDPDNNPAPPNVARYFSKQFPNTVGLNNGVLILDVTDQVGQEVAVTFRDFSRKITIPYLGRVALVKMPAALWSQIPQTEAADFSPQYNFKTPPTPTETGLPGPVAAGSGFPWLWVFIGGGVIFLVLTGTVLYFLLKDESQPKVNV